MHSQHLSAADGGTVKPRAAANTKLAGTGYVANATIRHLSAPARADAAGGASTEPAFLWDCTNLKKKELGKKGETHVGQPGELELGVPWRLIWRQPRLQAR